MRPAPFAIRSPATGAEFTAGFHVVGEGPTMFGTLRHTAMAKALSPSLPA